MCKHRLCFQKLSIVRPALTEKSVICVDMLFPEPAHLQNGSNNICLTYSTRDKLMSIYKLPGDKQIGLIILCSLINTLI